MSKITYWKYKVNPLNLKNFLLIYLNLISLRDYIMMLLVFFEKSFYDSDIYNKNIKHNSEIKFFTIFLPRDT